MIGQMGYDSGCWAGEFLPTFLLRTIFNLPSIPRYLEYLIHADITKAIFFY